MFNYSEIDKTPTVNQIKAIIDYMENDPKVRYNFNFMMKMNRYSPNKILLDLNNTHCGRHYEIVFGEDDEILSFEQYGTWIS